MRAVRPAADEKPRHKVTLTKDFFLCDREVTVRQFKEFVQKVADDPKCTKDGEGDRKELGRGRQER